jgi:hypothetical protein
LNSRWILAAIGLYAFTVLAYFVLPAGGEFGRILIGSAVYNHDAVLNAGILEWGYQSLWTHGLHFFDWPPGFPLKNGLAGTENLIGWQLIYSPMRFAGASVAASYNVTLLSSLVIAGTTCAALARRLGASIRGAMIGGFVFAFNPFHLDHLVHVQTMAVCWSPLAILGLDMSLEKRSIRGLSLLAAGILLTVASGMYFAVFLAMVLPAYAILCWVTRRHRFSATGLLWIFVTALGCVALLVPILRHYVDFAEAYGRYPHQGSEIALSALTMRSLVQTPIWLSTWSRTATAASGTGYFASAFPGLITIGLAGVGVFSGRSHRESRATKIILIVLAVTCLLLAFGPTVQMRTGETAAWFSALPLPGKLWLHLSAIRWPMRIFLYSVLCFAVLAAFGTHKLLSSLNDKWRSPVSLLILALLFVELRPAGWFAARSLAIADPSRISDAYSFLKRENDRGGIVELPIKMDSGLATPYATRYAYGSASHLRGVIAFHGSMYPPVLESLRVASHFLPAPHALQMMELHGVSRLVIHSDMMSADSSRLLVESMKSRGYPVVFSSQRSTIFALTR